MRTPQEYIKNIENRIITADMLAAAIYSVNKRAKNHRNNERYYRSYRYDKYNNVDKEREKKEEMYRYKEQMLALLSPTAIHCEERVKWIREYFDDEYVPYYAAVEGVDFISIREIRYNYFAVYTLAGYSFHRPIVFDYEEDSLSREDYPEFKDLPFSELKDFVTKGEDINELYSMQFVKKILTLIESGDYQLMVG